MAAATDMISYMDFGGHLAEEFQAYRASLGMAPDTLYFNNGLTVIDRAAWTKAETGRAHIALHRGQSDNSACASSRAPSTRLLKGNVARLSPRFNFMGDFMRLDLESEIRPNVYHFVNRPKPWQRGWVGDPRFAQVFKDWFAGSPWPDFPDDPPIGEFLYAGQSGFSRASVGLYATQRFAAPSAHPTWLDSFRHQRFGRWSGSYTIQAAW